MPVVVNRGPLPSLTGLRWIAAFMVFAFHIRMYFGGSFGKLVQWITYGGHLGVSFFFILSGFVLMWSARDGDRPTAFWRRRIARIYPLHLVTAFMALALAFTILPKMRPSGVWEALANIFLVSAWRLQWWQSLNSVSWSLTCEAFFYFCFPLLHWVLRRLPVPVLWTVFLTFGLSIPLLAWISDAQHLQQTLLTTFPLFRLPEFILGAAAARLVQLGAWRGPKLDLAVGLTVIGYFVAVYTHNSFRLASATLIGFATLIPAAAVADLRNETSSWRHPALVKLGEWSFAFYMIHVMVMRIFELKLGRKPTMDPLPAIVISLTVFAIALGMAATLYYLVEMPGRRLVMKPWRKATPAAPALPHQAEPGDVPQATVTDATPADQDLTPELSSSDSSGSSYGGRL